MGFFISSGSTVYSCTASANKGDGINITGDTIVRENTSDGNGAGIHATGNDNRIEGNNVTDNDRGIDVGLAGNFIVKNTASGNPAGAHYVFIGVQTVGPIVSATGTIVNTNPWANFEF